MIVDNLVHFARVLRRAGLQVGPDRVLSAIAAVQAVGVERREDLHAALSAVMLDRHEQQAIFDAAFDAFFRDPKLLERLMYLMLPKVAGRGEKERAAQAQRLTEALSAPREKTPRPPAPDTGHDEVHAAQRMHLVVSSKAARSSADCSRSLVGSCPSVMR